MYDEASYIYSSIAHARTSSPAPVRQDATALDQSRKTSLLDRTSQLDDSHTSPAVLRSTLSVVQEARLPDPPKATVARRAQSYTDFHHAARRVLKTSRATNRNKRRSVQIDVADHGLNGSLSDVIKTDSDYERWFSDIERDLIDANHEKLFLRYRQLDITENHLDGILQQTTSTLRILDTLSNEFLGVGTQTAAFRKQCEALLKEQKQMEQMSEDLEQNLKFYNYLDPVSRRLNAPGAGSLVKSDEFSEMLMRIDGCLRYMAAHPNHKEASIYRSRYRQLMTRGLTLVRSSFVGGLRDIASDVSRRIADKQLNDTTMSALLYAKFRVGASEYKAVAQEISKRAHNSAGAEGGQENEYQSLMNELYTSYSATRGKLVIPLARKKMAEIALAPSTNKDLVAFARSAIGYTRGVCADEHDLWQEWFSEEESMNEFLESVCEPLYDHLRPRIIYETKLVNLCDLCTLLQNQFLHDPEDELDAVAANQFDLAPLIQPVLEDAQTRLVFRAQTILRDDIERYKPKKEDLDYPQRKQQLSTGANSTGKIIPLSGRKGSTAQTKTTANGTGTTSKDDSEIGDGREKETWLYSGNSDSESWYPTLRKAIWLLSRIYRLVHSIVFDDLAHAIVHATTHSLISASLSISKLPHHTPSDGRLFLIRYLLLLKSQIVAFDVEYVSADVSFDFSNLTNTFAELQRERGGLFDPRNWYRLMRGGLLPQVVENMFDAKAELDGQLRTVINEFTSTSASTMTFPINAAAKASPAFDPVVAVGKVREGAQSREIPLLRRLIEQYIDDLSTRETLVAAVQEVVVHTYEQFYNGLNESGAGKDKVPISTPDAFAEWAGEVFDVKGVEGFGGQSTLAQQQRRRRQFHQSQSYGSVAGGTIRGTTTGSQSLVSGVGAESVRASSFRGVR